MSVLEHPLVHLDLGEHRMDVVLHVDVERRLALLEGQAEQVGHAAHGRSLDQQRDDGSDEDHIKEQLGMLDARHERVGGKDNRHGAAQPHPRDVEPGLGGEATEGGHAE